MYQVLRTDCAAGCLPLGSPARVLERTTELTHFRDLPSAAPRVWYDSIIVHETSWPAVAPKMQCRMPHQKAQALSVSSV
jgi:hypothetical protein